MSQLQSQDPKLYAAIKAEESRQEHEIELIASENYISTAVMEAMGSMLNNKYSEGYPGKRYYGGNQCIDNIENLAIERAKELFGAEHVNVQPLSGSPANMAVFFAFLNPGDKVLGLSLDHGGHLSHGHPVNFSGILYDFCRYEVEADGRINMDKVEEIALREKPKMIIAGFSAYSRDMDWKRFKEIADKIGAILFADIAHIAGLIAGKQIENPIPYCDVVTTTTHKTLRGPRGAIIMCKEEHAKKVDKAIFPGLQGGPHDHITAARAVAFAEALKPEFQDYAAQVIKNAQALAEELMGYGFKIVSDGTDNHLMLIDMNSKNTTGKIAEKALEDSGLSVNKNMVPFDPRSPFDPSGIRIGTPAVTTRGMKEEEMKTIARFINEACESPEDSSVHDRIRGEVKEMCANFPVPGLRI
ncbi:MAG: serine hydroxymethyltransferase [Candidatus Peregrinibacteria bacterium]|nr:serine hydroxymethyltransferase [Candidatus Peregrinibacteria bacterium]MDZ4244801.1 serine hydroxymethyltransferase [Candidatus Gracilibacteria bacterium]